MTFHDRLIKAAEVIQKKAPGFTPQFGLILGTGLGPLSKEITDRIEISYQDIPDFPISTVLGHEGIFILGKLNEVPVACLSGRTHMYECMSFEKVKIFVRILKYLGCHTLFTTSAVGSIRKEFEVGELVMISDHINFLGYNPLSGPNDEEFGPRFFSMDNAYDKELREFFKNIAKDENITLREGVYTSTMGPSFETPAEIKAFHNLGADIIGMSVIPEVLVAKHCGLKVAAFSVVTNQAAGLSDESISHEDNLQQAEVGAFKLRKLFKAFFQNFSDEMVKEQNVELQDLNTISSKILYLTDLINLDLNCTEEDITSLCRNAINQNRNVASICVPSKFVRLARNSLWTTPVKISTVVNFPDGNDNIEKVTLDIEKAIDSDVDEINLVFPYEDFLNGKDTKAMNFIRVCNETCDDQILLNIILETGRFPNTATIYQATRLAIDAGANFVVTSTGTGEINATPEATAAILLAIKDSQKPVGFKAYFGIKNAKDALQYLTIAEYIMGTDWISEDNFRFGSKTLLK